MKNKIALFGTCQAKGVCSHYVINDEKLGGEKGICLKSFKRYSILNKLNSIYGTRVDDMIETYDRWRKRRGRGKKRFISVILKHMSKYDLNRWDSIVLFLPRRDFISQYKSCPTIKEHKEKLYSNYKSLFEYLEKTYKHKKIILVMPPYINPKNIFSENSSNECYNILKELISGRNYNYKVISFYHYLKHLGMNDDQISMLFPDNTHPTIDAQILMTDYVCKKIEQFLKD